MKKLNTVKVSNMKSNRHTGSSVSNQFEIITKDGIYFQSYSSIIAFKELKTGKIYLDVNKWNYSKTTGIYRNQFLNETVQETRAKIARKEYILTDLN
jgi:hypothetical protein